MFKFYIEFQQSQQELFRQIPRDATAENRNAQLGNLYALAAPLGSCMGQIDY